jgi:hypothetical protein
MESINAVANPLAVAAASRAVSARSSRTAAATTRALPVMFTVFQYWKNVLFPVVPDDRLRKPPSPEKPTMHPGLALNSFPCFDLKTKSGKKSDARPSV